MIVIIARFFHLPVCSRILSFCRGALVVIVHQLAREEFIRPDNFILFANAFLKEGGGGYLLRTMGSRYVFLATDKPRYKWAN